MSASGTVAAASGRPGHMVQPAPAPKSLFFKVCEPGTLSALRADRTNRVGAASLEIG